MTDSTNDLKHRDSSIFRYTNQKYQLFDKIYENTPFNIPNNQSEYDIANKSKLVFSDVVNNETPAVPNRQQNNAQSKADIAAWILDENNNDLSTLTARNVLPENVNTNTRIQEANVPNRVPTPSTGPSRGNISNNSSSVHPVSSSISMSSSNKLNHSASNNSNVMTTTTNTNSLSSKSNSIVSSNNASNASKYTIDPKCLPFYETPVSLYYDQLCTFHNYKHFEQFDEDYDEHPEDPKRVAEIFDSICKNKRLFVPEKVHETITAQGRPALGPGYKKTVTIPVS